jgi:hypothetical protein
MVAKSSKANPETTNQKEYPLNIGKLTSWAMIPSRPNRNASVQLPRFGGDNLIWTFLLS